MKIKLFCEINDMNVQTKRKLSENFEGILAATEPSMEFTSQEYSLT